MDKKVDEDILISLASGRESRILKVVPFELEDDEKKAAKILVDYFMNNVSGTFVEEFVKEWQRWCSVRGEGFCKRYNILCDCCNCRFKCWTEK